MTRHILTAAILLALPAVTFAQAPPPPPPQMGVGGFGGGVRPAAPLLPRVSPLMPNISPAMPNISPTTTGLGGGFNRTNNWNNWNPGFPVWGNGGWFPLSGYGYAAPLYQYPMVVEVPVPVPVVAQPPEAPIPISGEAMATLVLVFPAAAEVWVNGKKGEGDPQTDWTLTSPALRSGAEYTFEVKARWKANGKTYGYERTVAVAAGNRSKASILSGTEIKE